MAVRSLFCIKRLEELFSNASIYSDGSAYFRDVNTPPSFASWVPMGGTQAVITPLEGDPNVMLIGNQLREYGVELYNPTRFRITMKDGTQYVVSTQNGLESMTDTNGHSLVFSYYMEY